MTPLRLRDVCAKIGSGATPRGGKDVYLESGEVALIRSQNVYNDRFERNGLVFIGQEHSDQLSNVEVQGNDVLLNITGNSVARVCQIPADVLPARVNQHVAIIRPDSCRLDPRFLRFFLASPQMQAEMLALAAAGATRNALTKGMIESFEVPDLSVEVQRTIAALLGALEDKIELNRRMNKTLEAMARAIFKDWFVDFGPTRAKAEGRAPYLAPKFWDLFPDKLDDEETPEGWETKPLEDCLERLKVGKLYDQKSVLPTGRVPVLDQGKSGIIGFHDNEANIQASPKRRVSIFANHTCLQRLLDFNFSTIQNVIPFVGHQLPTEWVHYASLGKQKFEEYRGHWPSFIVHSVTVPTTELASTYAQLVDPLLLKISVNQTEAKTLTQTRDCLLPKLMSGEIRLAEAEKTVEAVA